MAHSVVPLAGTGLGVCEDEDVCGRDVRVGCGECVGCGVCEVWEGCGVWDGCVWWIKVVT